MWKAFHNSGADPAPKARLSVRQVPQLSHLADVMDPVLRAEFRWRAAKDRAFIEGQRYTLLSHRATLTTVDRRSLQKLLDPTIGWQPPTCQKKVGQL